MKRMLGDKVDVFLKFDNDIISGILFEIEDECVYIQSDIGGFVAIPKENIKYYASKSSCKSKPIVFSDNVVEKEQDDSPDAIEVRIDQELITKIPVPPTFDLSYFSDNIMKVVLGNSDVQAVLVNRTQKSIEYFPGKMHITTGEENYTTTPIGEISNPPNQPMPANDSFSMAGSGSPMSSYLNPSQMVGRLNKVAKRKPEEIKNEK